MEAHDAGEMGWDGDLQYRHPTPTDRCIEIGIYVDHHRRRKHHRRPCYASRRRHTLDRNTHRTCPQHPLLESDTEHIQTERWCKLPELRCDLDLVLDLCLRSLLRCCATCDMSHHECRVTEEWNSSGRMCTFCSYWCLSAFLRSSFSLLFTRSRWVFERS